MFGASHLEVNSDLVLCLELVIWRWAQTWSLETWHTRDSVQTLKQKDATGPTPLPSPSAMMDPNPPKKKVSREEISFVWFKKTKLHKPPGGIAQTILIRKHQGFCRFCIIWYNSRLPPHNLTQLIHPPQRQKQKAPPPKKEKKIVCDSVCVCVSCSGAVPTFALLDNQTGNAGRAVLVNP